MKTEQRTQVYKGHTITKDVSIYSLGYVLSEWTLELFTNYFLKARFGERYVSDDYAIEKFSKFQNRTHLFISELDYSSKVEFGLAINRYMIDIASMEG